MSTIKPARRKTGPKPQQKLPIEPLVALWEPGTWDRIIAEACGLGSRSNLWNFKRYGGIPVYRADTIAIHLGLHPASIWGQQWWDLALEGDTDDAG